VDFEAELDKCREYGEIFSLVKRAVKKSLGEHRVGLMLFLGDLPMKVGAFHVLGTNDIILNRRLLNKVVKEKPPSEQKAFLFSILMHEYLHSLGYVDEREVRGLVYQICADNFGRKHYVTDTAITGPWASLSEEDFQELGESLNLEMVKDFERTEYRYII
jgi:hypothetical protein